MTEQNLSTLQINKLSQKQFDREEAAGRLDQSAWYLTPEEAPDKTLTVDGAAADAKATGDRLEIVESALLNIPAKTSELENDSNFITEQYYKDNREFYDDRAVSKTFTLQTILNPAAGFTLTAKNDSYEFFSNLREYYKITQHSYRDWYVVDRLAVSYDKGEWLNFESGEDYLVLVTYRDNYDRCELAVYNHAGDKLLWYDGTLRDAEGNISYDWGVLGLNTDIIPIPDISGLDIINLDFAFYGTTGELKKLDRKFIDLELPSKVSELENDSNFITISDVDLSGYVEKIEMPEIDIDEVIEKTTDGVNRYEPLTEGWIDNSEITQNGENFESNSNYYCITPKIRVWTDREYVATLNNERYHGYIAMYDASGNYIQTNYINDGVFHTHIQINAQTLSVNYVRFNVDRKNDITTTIEDFNNYFKLELLSNYRLKDTVQLPEAVTPSAPTKVSELENDSGFITESALPNINIDNIVEKQEPSINLYKPVPAEEWTNGILGNPSDDDYAYCIIPAEGGKTYTAVGLIDPPISLLNRDDTEGVQLDIIPGFHYDPDYINAFDTYIFITPEDCNYLALTIFKNNYDPAMDSDIGPIVDNFNSVFMLLEGDYSASETIPFYEPYSNKEYKLKDNIEIPALPEVTEEDNGKVLMVVNGKWQVVNLNLTVDENGNLVV